MYQPVGEIDWRSTASDAIMWGGGKMTQSFSVRTVLKSHMHVAGSSTPAVLIRTEYCISIELHTTGNRLGLSIASFKSSVDGNEWGKQPELQMKI